MFRVINQLESETPAQITKMPVDQTAYHDGGHFPPSYRLSRPTEELRAIEGLIATLIATSSPTPPQTSCGLFGCKTGSKVIMKDAELNFNSLRDFKNEILKSAVLEKLQNLYDSFEPSVDGVIQPNNQQFALSLEDAREAKIFLSKLRPEANRFEEAQWQEVLKIHQEVTGPGSDLARSKAHLLGNNQTPGDRVVPLVAFMIINMAVSRFTQNPNLMDPPLLLKSAIVTGLSWVAWRVMIKGLIQRRERLDDPHTGRYYPPSHSEKARVNMDQMILRANQFLKSNPSPGQFFFYHGYTPESLRTKGSLTFDLLIRMNEERQPILSVFIQDPSGKVTSPP